MEKALEDNLSRRKDTDSIEDLEEITEIEAKRLTREVENDPENR